MAVPANTYKTYETKGIREQLSDIIYDISPEETPFVSNAGRGERAENTLYEWQTDALAAVDTANAKLEGDEFANDAIAPTVRLKNYQQISSKVAQISASDEAVRKAGRKSEMSYQVTKRGAELRRDIEAIMLSNQGLNVGAAGTARKTGALLAFIKTNVDKEASGTNPVYTDTPDDPRNDGSLRSITEAMLKTVIQLAWNEGGKPDTLMVGGLVKQAVSAFAGIATKTYQMTQAKTAAIVGAADVYVSDFGTFVVVPNRFQRARDAFVLDFDLVSLRYLRPFKTEKLAKTGDSERRAVVVEYGLQVNQEKGLGLIADIQP